jgi:hypothetical protein
LDKLFVKIRTFEPKKQQTGEKLHEKLHNLHSVQNIVGLEVLTATTLKSTTYWTITPCTLVKAHQRFGGSYRKQSLSQTELVACLLCGSCFIYFSTLNMEA